jgi:hypothetical protein
LLGAERALPVDSRPSDTEEIARAIKLLHTPDEVVELRVLKAVKGGIVSGYFRGPNWDALIQAAAEWSGKAPGIYLTLNPVDPVLLARANNRAKRFADCTTKDSEILRRRWLPIDFDPVRPGGMSSTEAEHQAAIDRARQCRDYLRSRDFPDPILLDSGNGGHLLYRVDLPNNEESTVYIKGVSNRLADRFSDAVVNVDRNVFNASRIWKLSGTLAMKGDSIPERPHRIARILEIPE